MNLQAWANFAERQLLSAMILGHVVLTILFQMPAIRPEFPAVEIIADTLPFTQSALLIGWGILGPGRIAVRLFSVLGLAAVYGAWTLHWGLAETNDLTAIFVAVEVGILLVCLGLLAGMQQICYCEEPPQAMRLQYSLRCLLAMMTLYAILLAAGNRLRQYAAPLENVPPWVGCTLLGVTFAAVTLLTAWAVLKADNLWLSGVITLVAAPLLGMLLTLLVGRDKEAIHFAGWMEAHAAIFGLSLVPMRLCGYRLKRVYQESTTPGE
ncbi:MAG: hypothetical protein ACKVP0_03110 [Pirellulaceae bacterium]